MLTKLKEKILLKIIVDVLKSHRKEITSMPKWLHNVLSVLFTVGSVYASVKYPAFVPAITAIGAAAGLVVTNNAFNTDPNKK